MASRAGGRRSRSQYTANAGRSRRRPCEARAGNDGVVESLSAHQRHRRPLHVRGDGPTTRGGICVRRCMVTRRSHRSAGRCGQNPTWCQSNRRLEAFRCGRPRAAITFGVTSTEDSPLQVFAPFPGSAAMQQLLWLFVPSVMCHFGRFCMRAHRWSSSAHGRLGADASSRMSSDWREIANRVILSPNVRRLQGGMMPEPSARLWPIWITRGRRICGVSRYDGDFSCCLGLTVTVKKLMHPLFCALIYR